MALEQMTDCDALCFPVYFPIVNKVRDCVRRVRARRPELPIIVGGPQAALFTDTVLDLGDYAVTCEGDEVLPQLLATLGSGGDPRGCRASPSAGAARSSPRPRRRPRHPATIPDLGLIDGSPPSRAASAPGT